MPDIHFAASDHVSIAYDIVGGGGEATEEEFEESMSQIASAWGTGRRFGNAIPSVGDVAWGREWRGRVQKNAGTPRAMEGFFRFAFDIDVRHVASTINVPTLILHTVDDEVCHVENARFLARTIPEARHIEQPGGKHLPWFKDADAFIGEVWVSDSVRQLVARSGLFFEDRGARRLKGVTGAWELYAVAGT